MLYKRVVKHKCYIFAPGFNAKNYDKKSINC